MNMKKKVSKSKNGILKANLKKYLHSRGTGGLYGLTISHDDFVDEMIKVIRVSRRNKNWEPKKEKKLYDEILWGNGKVWCNGKVIGNS